MSDTVNDTDAPAGIGLVGLVVVSSGSFDVHLMPARTGRMSAAEVEARDLVVALEEGAKTPEMRAAALEKIAERIPLFDFAARQRLDVRAAAAWLRKGSVLS